MLWQLKQVWRLGTHSVASHAPRPLDVACLMLCRQEFVSHNAFGLRRRRSLLTCAFEDLGFSLAGQSLTNRTFQGHPLASMCPKNRGEILAQIARNALSDMYPNSEIVDAPSRLCVNGARRGWNRTEFDWLWDGQRVECKSSMITFVPSQGLWKANFAFINFKLFGVLLLLLYTPRGIYICRADFQPNECAKSVRQAIQVYGKADWEDSVDIIMDKLKKRSPPFHEILQIPLDHWRIQTAVDKYSVEVMGRVYRNVPLRSLTPSRRGLYLECLARRVDEKLHPESTFKQPLSGICSNGASRGKHNAEYDWIRDDRRIECKSSQLKWDKSTRRWCIRFAKIKFAFGSMRLSDSFDELLLVIYAPYGIDVYRHDDQFGVSLRGVDTATRGHAIQVYGPAQQEDWESALETIYGKLRGGGCKRLAHISWPIQTSSNLSVAV